MNLNEVIEYLQKLREEKGGEMIVFVNGEHGEAEPEMCAPGHFSVGAADLTLGGELAENPPFGIRKGDTIMQIGGY